MLPQPPCHQLKSSAMAIGAGGCAPIHMGHSEVSYARMAAAALLRPPNVWGLSCRRPPEPEARKGDGHVPAPCWAAASDGFAEASLILGNEGRSSAHDSGIRVVRG